MDSLNHFDVIVVGGGVMGLASAYAVSQRGKRALLLEREHFFNDQGSSGGLSRMWRVIYSERYLAELALHTAPHWHALEEASGTTLIDRTGILWFGQPKTPTTEGQIESAMQTMDALGLPYTRLTARDLPDYGFANLPPDYIGVFQADAGTIHAREVLTALHRLSAANGAALRDNMRVTSVTSDSTGVTVGAIEVGKTTGETFRADKLILCPGPYINDLTGLLGFQLDLEIWEMASAYFRLKREERNYPVWFQFQEPVGDDPALYYGFPANDWERRGLARVAPDFASRILRSPEYRSRAVDVEDLRKTVRYVQRAMPNLEPTPLESSTCLIAMTQDQNPVLDFAPDFVPFHRNIALYVGGWGYKFAPLVGRILADLVLSGQTEEDVAKFTISRAGVLSQESRYRSIIRNGLGRTDTPRRVAIAGAGMAGLVAGELLRRAGHEVVIVEASDRVGGRIRTLRAEFDQSCGLQYAEAGAMRIPQFHLLVQDYIRKLGLRVNPFLETDRDKRAYLLINGQRIRVGDYGGNPDVLGYQVAATELGMTADQLLDAVIQPIVKFVAADPTANWPTVLDRFDRHSVRSFLKEQTLYSEAAIEMIGVLLDEEELMSTSFIESIRDQTDINSNNSYVEIEGGMDHLPRALESLLGTGVRLNTRVTRVAQHADGTASLIAGTEEFLADRVLITLPFSALRHVEVTPAFSPGKRKAIRELHYDCSTKILLQFRRRFWEQDDGIFGGGSITDLPIRFTFYPSHGLGIGGPAVLLASYTWGDDSQRWDSLESDERIERALDDLTSLHGPVVRQEFLQGASHSWMRDHFTLGAFALFNPGQQTELLPYIASSEGSVHFAGEHTTLKHAWIEGAIESGIRAALEIHAALVKASPDSSSLSSVRTVETPTGLSASSANDAALVQAMRRRRGESASVKVRRVRR